MKIVLKYSILIIVGLIVLFSLYKFIKSKEKKSNENFRYQFSALSRAKQGEKIIEKINQGIKLYNKVKSIIPKVKKIFETMTDWNKLKNKMCLWASKQQLLAGLIAVTKKAMNIPNLQTNILTILEKLKQFLIKLQIYQAMSVSVKGILNLIPNIPNEIITGVNIFANIDNNIVDLFSKAGLNLGC